MPIVNLSSEQTEVASDSQDRLQAIDAAMYLTLSPHEWEWSIDQQIAMAEYVLWASQRLDAIKQMVSGDLTRPLEE